MADGRKEFLGERDLFQIMALPGILFGGQSPNVVMDNPYRKQNSKAVRKLQEHQKKLKAMKWRVMVEQGIKGKT